MYYRSITPCPAKFVSNGKCLFGTHSGHPERLDIRGVEQPYSSLTFLPVWITNLRIKSRLSYFFLLDKYAGCIEFFDAKAAGYAELIFWDTETKQRFVYRSVLGPRKRFIPHNLNTGCLFNRNKHRYLRISWDNKTGRLSVIFNMTGNSAFPGTNAAFSSPLQSDKTAEITVIMPSPTLRRCSAHYMQTLPLHGTMTLSPKNKDSITMSDKDGIAFFDMTRSYMKFHTSGEYLTGFGYVDGRQISFRLQVSSQEPVQNDIYNANVLFCDNETTPLPNVRITHSYGIMKPWNIQDTENMVDLQFTPISEYPARISALVVRTEYHTIYGTFEGTLMTSSGEKISFKALAGISKKYRIRL